jgi:hypothetical protein
MFDANKVAARASLPTDLDVVNLAFAQPFSEFFVLVHDETVEPLFTLGFPPSEPLAILAEDGSTCTS